MKIPFTLDAWLKDKSQKVETRDGRPVKIISFEMTDTNDCPIAAQFRLCAGTPVVYLFDKDGHYKGEGDSDYDLFIVIPEPEMSEFENGMLRYLQDAANKKDDSEIVESTKEHSIKLLSIARNEFNKQIENDYREIIHGAYKRGKADAEQEVERRLQSGELLTQEHHEQLMETLCEECKKDLPRWRNGSIEGDRIVGLSLYHDSKWIPFFDLEKLPGFKDEDYE